MHRSGRGDGGMLRSGLGDVRIMSTHSNVPAWMPVQGGAAPRMARKAVCVMMR